MKAAFHQAIHQSGEFSISEFSTWPKLFEFDVVQPGFRGKRTIKPDGYITISRKETGQNSKQAFFLEIDRSTEPPKVLLEKALNYRRYYRSGGFARRHGAEEADVSRHPFRVLMTFPTAERRNIIAALLSGHSEPILTQVLLGIFPEVIANPLGSVWLTPHEYRRVLEDSLFAVSRENHEARYRRSTERDELVSKQAKLLPLLPSSALCLGPI